MKGKILFVDDDKNLLSAIRRNLKKEFDIDTAESGLSGIQKLNESGPYGVVVSDMRMPEMNGLQFLEKVKLYDKDIVRIMLTGNSDIETAINAVNEGQVFRFLTKPCRADILGSVIKTALDQYRLLKIEKDLLEKTLHGSVKVLSEILGLINPLAFSKSERIARIVKHITSELKLNNPWEFEVAALLSLIGYVAIPNELLEKKFSEATLSEREISQVSEITSIGEKLLQNIPRMENVSKIIGTYEDTQELPLEVDNVNELDRIQLGAAILKIATDFEKSLTRLDSQISARQQLQSDWLLYPPFIVKTLETLKDSPNIKRFELPLEKVKPGMILDASIYSKNETMLATKGQEITKIMLQRLKAFAERVGIKEPIHIIES